MMEFTCFRNGKLDIISLYINRFLRITPTLAVIILISVSVLRFLGSGPMWSTSIYIYSAACQRYWWSALLHVQNYVNPNQVVKLNISKIASNSPQANATSICSNRFGCICVGK